MVYLRRVILGFLLLACLIVNGQKKNIINGKFSQANSKEIELVVFNALKDSIVAQTMSDVAGNFVLSYPENYVGAAMLKVKDGTNVVVLLNKEDFLVEWSDFNDFNTLHFNNSVENTVLYKGITTYQKSEELLNTLKHLKALYADSARKQKWINQEIEIHENDFLDYVTSLPKTSYVAHYLLIGRLMNDMAIASNLFPEGINKNEKDFKAIDFLDPKLLHSGLMKDLINNFYQMIQSTGNQEKVSEHANEITDVLLKSLYGNPELKKEIAEYLYKRLEEQSLFGSAEYLALKMLADNTCVLDDNSAKLYSQYAKMAVGQVAPELLLVPNTKGFSSIGQIKSKHKLVVFGSSECPKCKVDIPELKKFYSRWHDQYDMEIVFISVDTDPVSYINFAKDFPWVSSCDFNGWNSRGVLDYGVVATPTMYLLDSSGKILLKPFSASQIDSWLPLHKSGN